MTELIQEEVRKQQAKLDNPSRSIYSRMVAIIEELPAIGKTQKNVQQNFMFRGHDDVMNALNPLLAKHGVFIVPDVRERIQSERTTSRGATMYEVNLHVAFTFYGLGGDSFTGSGWGEGTDMGDKATSKAMTMAFKYVVGQAFALATEEMSDPDAGSAEETTRVAAATGQTEAGPGDSTPQSALKSVAAPKTWKALEAMITAYGVDVWEAWRVFGNQARVVLFGEPDGELSKEQKDKLWRVTTRAAQALAETKGPDEIPPPERATLAAAWQKALHEATGVADYELEGPAWRFGKDEDDREPRA